MDNLDSSNSSLRSEVLIVYETTKKSFCTSRARSLCKKRFSFAFSAKMFVAFDDGLLHDKLKCFFLPFEKIMLF